MTEQKMKYWPTLRLILVIGLICLTLWFIIINDLSKAFFTALFAILFYLNKGTYKNSEQGIRGYTILLESTMRKEDRPETVLRRTVDRMIRRGKPSKDEILDILEYFIDRNDEVGKEAQKLWNELASEESSI
ncbi:MAG: hypothetical protein JW779_01295 [Candidatus Thorarchaeota archaeon]|nr:hypothetical protein [Candidatus Thorarchaeota archaeon]